MTKIRLIPVRQNPRKKKRKGLLRRIFAGKRRRKARSGRGAKAVSRRREKKYILHIVSKFKGSPQQISFWNGSKAVWARKRARRYNRRDAIAVAHAILTHAPKSVVGVRVVPA